MLENLIEMKVPPSIVKNNPLSKSNALLHLILGVQILYFYFFLYLFHLQRRMVHVSVAYFFFSIRETGKRKSQNTLRSRNTKSRENATSVHPIDIGFAVHNTLRSVVCTNNSRFSSSFH